MSAYRALAAVYDRLMRPARYGRRARFIHRIFRSWGVSGLVLDAGCGTGELTLRLARLGYDMIGVDSSEDMLAVAYTKAAGAGADIVFLRQDLAALDLYGTVRGIVCTLDTLNHVGGALPEVLARFALFLERGGVLVFDINTPYKHREVLGNNSFIYEFAGGLCVWRNSYEPERGRVRLEVDVSSAAGYGAPCRSTDVFYEYTIEPRDIERMLAELGFEIAVKADGDSFGGIAATSERIIYAAVRK